MEKLKIKIWNIKNVILFNVLEQDESLRGKSVIYKEDNVTISSEYLPDIITTTRGVTIYIRGRQQEKDYTFSCVKVPTETDAIEIVRKVKQAVENFNKHNSTILDSTEKKYLSRVIEPFKKEIVHIAKGQSPVDENREYILIKFKDDDCMIFKSFKKNTMYKGMIQGGKYTLDLLGLN